MMQETVVPNPSYVLGHSNHELERLIHQARFFGDLTEHVLHLAGLKPGMRVLDVGCGAGDVSFLAANMVGPEGEVIGVDKSPEAIALATQRATATGLTNVRFIQCDLSELTLDEPVDALIGRLVLMYFADPSVIVRRLTQAVKPGGLVVFHEIDLSGAKSEPLCAVFETTLEWIRQAFSRAGADIKSGLKLSRIFQEAGLPKPQMIQGGRVECGADSPIYKQIEGITRTLLPIMEVTGVVAADEVGIDTLADRIRAEAVAINTTLVSPLFIGAWAQKAS